LWVNKKFIWGIGAFKKKTGKEFLIGRVLSMRNSYEKKSVVREWDFKNTEKKYGHRSLLCMAYS